MFTDRQGLQNSESEFDGEKPPKNGACAIEERVEHPSREKPAAGGVVAGEAAVVEAQAYHRPDQHNRAEEVGKQRGVGVEVGQGGAGQKRYVCRRASTTSSPALAVSRRAK